METEWAGRLICKCGWVDRPSCNDYWFTQTIDYCPECGECLPLYSVDIDPQKMFWGKCKLVYERNVKFNLFRPSTWALDSYYIDGEGNKIEFKEIETAKGSE